MRTLIKVSIYFLILVLVSALIPLKINAATLVWTPPEQVSNLTGNNGPYLSIGIDSHNTIHAVWETQGGLNQSGNPYPTVYYANKPEGGSWTTPLNLSQYVPGFGGPNPIYSYFPNLFVDNQDKAHIVWSAGKLGDFGPNLYYAIRNPDSSWITPTASILPPGNVAYYPKINITPQGRINLAWISLESNFGLDVRYSTKASYSSSDPWSQSINLSNSGGITEFSMTSDADGNVSIVWPKNFVGLIFTEKNGNAWTNPQPIIGIFGRNPKIITDNGKNLHLFWSSSNFPHAIMYSNRNFGFSDWTTPIQLSTGLSGTYPSAVIDSNNVIHLLYSDVFQDNTGNGVINTWYATKESSGWSNPIQLSNNTNHFDPSIGDDIAVDKNNFPHVIWYQSASLFYDYQKIADSLPPTTTLTQSPQANSNGWNNTNVNITLNATDNIGGSGVKEIHYAINGGTENIIPGNTASFAVSTEGTDTINYWSVDNAGNIEQTNTYSLKIDKTPPSVTINSPMDGNSYILNQPVVANWSVSDSLSGIDSYNGTVASGQNIDTSTVGAHSFMVSAADKAGNTTTKTVIYYVHYNFGGFQAPLGNNKVFKTGGTIPIKLQLTDYNGNIISNATVYLYVAKITNDVVGTDEAATSTSNADTGNQFRYDQTGNQYIYNLSTQNPPLGTSGTYQLKASLDDGTNYTTNISLK